MKRFLVTIATFLGFYTQAQTLTSYTVYKGSMYPDPPLTGTVGNTLEAYVYLDYTWNQLYLSSDNSTHKIVGVSDFVGRNSLRLGVRRATTSMDGVIAVCYYHKNGKFYYPALKDSTGKNFIMKYETGYFVRIYKVSTGWSIELYDDTGNILLATATVPISVSSFLRRLQGPYIEVGSGPSLWTIVTKIKILKQ